MLLPFLLNNLGGVLAIISTSLTRGRLNVAYSYAIIASGGSAPYVFTIESGALPTGLSLDSATGIISGTPSETGTFSITVRVTDSELDFDDQAFTFDVVLSAPGMVYAHKHRGRHRYIWSPASA